MTIVSVGGIDFDCGWYAEEGDNGQSYPVLESVSVGGINITDVIDSGWWNKIEDELEKVLDADRKALRYEAELDRHEAYGI